MTIFEKLLRRDTFSLRKTANFIKIAPIENISSLKITLSFLFPEAIPLSSPSDRIALAKREFSPRFAKAT